MRKGDIFGIYNVLEGGTNEYSASANEDCSMLLVPKPLALHLLGNNQDFLLAVNSQLTYKIVRMLQRIAHIAFKSVRESVAMSIIELYETFDTDKEGFIDVSLTKEEIGQLASTTTSATIKLTNEFQKENMILIKNRKIKILDMERLYKEADIRINVL